ncbi:MAG TPA: M14 family zinc carboxypeptidase [Solirubrobacterales bacterium]|nr:M14 family zinc carboxypeptidase [Solirubrobacterales bacterium]
MAALAVLLSCGGATEVSAASRHLIGHSVHGRPIVLFTSAPADPQLRMLVVGDLHGDEAAGMRITRRLIAAPHPAGTELMVVPTINPDGLAAGTRGNARGVDFPFDWQPLSGGEYSGTGPLSEPESRAAYRLILRTRPDLTIWFHQPFDLVDRPAGNPFAPRRFSQLIGLPLIRLRGPYPGSATRWQNHRFPQSSALVVELPRRVTPSLIRRGTAAVRTLASELASPALSRGVAL